MIYGLFVKRIGSTRLVPCTVVASRLDVNLVRFYLILKEKVSPLIVIEFVSGDWEEKKDNSPPPKGDQTDPKTNKPELLRVWSIQR